MFKILLLLLLTGCANFIPKVRYSVSDLENIPIHKIYYECTGEIEKTIKKCNGGIKNGKFYCEKDTDFSCDVGGEKLFWAFDADSFSDLFNYVKYLHDSYNEVE